MSRRYAVALLMVACIVVGLAQGAAANNISVTNVALTGRDTATSNIFIRTDVIWENSWRDGLNWDAAWVFAKWRLAGTTNWSHCSLETSGHEAPADCTITNWDAAGAMLHRTTQGTGNITFSNVKLRWDYGADGLLDSADVELYVTAIEMVYVPEGAFQLGTWQNDEDNRRFFYRAQQTRDPYTVSSEDPLEVADSPGCLWAFQGRGINATTLSASYPKGYAAFYCMKYEISQKQYTDFLNKLTVGQSSQRYYTGGANRNTIGGSWPNFTVTVPDRACNYLSWNDDCAYADWAGLRPMTELEFEKACRGTETSVYNEYPWGNTSRYGSPYDINNDGQPNATVANKGNDPNGNALYNSTAGSLGGPVRCGIFAASIADPTRAEAGATYWGIMEMGGNLREHCIRIGNSGYNFTGLHGDGVLTAGGEDDVANWPDSGGAGFRGGSYSEDQQAMCVAYRVDADNGDGNRNANYGFRAVRSAP